MALPVLRKDFTVDARDVLDARIMGADCVLLIVGALNDDDLLVFHELAEALEMDALVEIHDEAELDRAMMLGASLLGVNQRDLVTFEVDQARAIRMAAAMPDSLTLVAESGIRDRDDVLALSDAGFDAILVGETLVRSGDPENAVRELRGI